MTYIKEIGFMALILSHTVRPLREVRVVNRNVEHYKQLVTSLQALLGPACPPIHRAPSASEALSGALLVTCATTATAPLFQWNEVIHCAHVEFIGRFTHYICAVDS